MLDAPSATLDGVSVHVRPVEGAVKVVRSTIPVRPLTAATVMVELPAWLTLRGPTLVGFASMVNPPTMKVTVTGCVNELLVPVTVTLFVPTLV